jgi:hypothetical protein
MPNATHHTPPQTQREHSPIYEFGYPGDIDIGYASWTVTVQQPSTAGSNITTTQYFGTPTGKNFRSGSLDFSGCTILMNNLPENLIKTGQRDSGNCNQTFNQACVDALSR